MLTHKQAMGLAKINGHEMGKIFLHGVTFCKKCNAHISPKYLYSVNKGTHTYAAISYYNADLVLSKCGE